MHWTFAPCIAVPQDERWGRTYEGFGETSDSPPCSVLPQSADSRDLRCRSRVACWPPPNTSWETAERRSAWTAEIPSAMSVRCDRPTWMATVRPSRHGSARSWFRATAGTASACTYKRLLTDVLRGELRFDGLLVSDWDGIDALAGDRITDVEQAINAGIDMVMVPNSAPEFIAALTRNVADGKVSMSRIDEAVRRILPRSSGSGSSNGRSATPRSRYSRIAGTSCRGPSGRPRVAGAARQSHAPYRWIRTPRISPWAVRRPTTSACNQAVGRFRGRDRAARSHPGRRCWRPYGKPRHARR